MPRIFIASDASGVLRPALELGAQLAASQRTQVEFILLRDQGSSRTAGLPEQRLVLHTGLQVALSASGLERSWRALGTRTREAVREVAGHAGVDIQFRSADGQLDDYVARVANAPLCVVVAPTHAAPAWPRDRVHLDAKSSWSLAAATRVACALARDVSLSAENEDVAERARTEALRQGATLTDAAASRYAPRIIATSPGSFRADDLRRWRRAHRGPLVIVTDSEES